MDIDCEPPNYHFDKDKAYTVDNLLVYNVFVDNIPKDTTKAEFSEYFKTFGDIICVDFPNRASQQSTKIGIVNYSDSLSAAKVLQNSNHSIDKNRIWVRAGDHQPDANTQAATAEAESTANVALILNLNDDCLDAIFKRLEVKDQLNFALCCRHVRDVFVMHAKVVYKNLDLGELEFLTLWESYQFLQMTGSQIEKLSGFAMGEFFIHVVEYLGASCTNVKSIHISRTIFPWNNMWKLLRNMYMIEELHIIDANLQDDDISVLKVLKNLKILSLDQNDYLTGNHIQYVSTVEILSLQGCEGIIPSLFIRICENLKDLKYLNIHMCSLLETSASDDSVFKYLPKLETLKLTSNNGENTSIASLPNLKHLHLCSFISLSSNIFEELAIHKAEQLETLDIRSCYSYINHKNSSSIGKLTNLKYLVCSNNDELDDKCLSNISQLQELEFLNIENSNGFSSMGLLDLIKKCPKLRTLNISNCKQLEKEFATLVLELLKSMKQQRCEKQLLEIIADNSGITPLAADSTANLLTISIKNELDSSYCDSDNDDWVITKMLKNLI